MPITSYFTKNNRQMSFSYNLISVVRAGKPESFFIVISDYPFMHLLYSQLLVCQRVCLQNTVCLICK